MPKEITSVKCHQCGDLIPSDGEYLIVDKLSVKGHAEESARSWIKQNQPVENIEDVVFCDANCLSQFATTKLEFPK